MGLTGPEKDRYNFVQQRIKEQREFWPQFVKELDEKSNGKRFRSEILSYEDLWNLYLHGIDESLTPEEESRGKKKSKVDKVSEVVPIKAFELPGRFSEIGKHHKGALGYLHYDQWLYARDQARKDLYWLCKDVFQLDLQPHVHQVVCDQFLTKNFDDVYSEGYSLKDFQNALDNQNRVPQHWVKTAEYEKRTLADFGHYVKDPIEQEKTTNFAKTMVLLDPRGFFKSTIDAIDAVQLIINCPDIRILIVSGVKKLGDQFLKMVKVGPKMRTFYLPKGVRPEPFHLLFPEFVVRGVSGTSDEPMIIGESSKAPQRYFSGDPTIGVISVGSSLSGFHCDYLKFDDIVTDDNCLTETTREAILLKADGAVNMLMGWGWHDIIGTRYFPDDYYGLTKKTHDDNPEMFNLKFFQRACWTVKSEFKEVEKKSLFELTEEMVTLTFPELVQTPHKSWLDLRKRMKNERSFRCQQLNQPVWGEESTIDLNRALLEAHRNKTFSEVMATGVDGKQQGYIYGAIDLARENKQFSDFTALAVGKVYQEGAKQSLSPDELSNSFASVDGKWILVILDVQFGKWSQTEIASRIASMHNKWKPIQWYGEDTGGLILLKEKIVDTCKTTYGHWPYIVWKTPENSDQAKRNRIRGIETLLRNDRMFFLYASWNDEVFEQIEKYKGQKSTRYFKDDVPDVISRLTQFVPSLISLSKKEIQEQTDQKEALYRHFVRQEMRKAIFGDDNGGFGMQPQEYAYYNPPPESRGPVDDIRMKYLGR
jgi:hypothetical protein